MLFVRYQSLVRESFCSLRQNDQLGIVSQFCGDPASLRVLEAAFSKNGQEWAAKNAHNLQKTISNQAVAEMQTVLDFHDYAESKGEFSFPIEKAHWTKNEFGRQASRLGYDLDELSDAYSLCLDMQMDGLNEQGMTINENDPIKAAKERATISAQKYKIAQAKQEIAQAKASGKDPAEMFNKAMKSIENHANNSANAD